MKIYISFIVISIAFAIAFAIPQRARQIAEVYPNEENEFSEASDLLPETNFEYDPARFEEPLFDSLVPDTVDPIDSPVYDQFPIEESPVDFPIEESPVDFPIEESPVDFPIEEIPADVPFEEDVPVVIPTDEIYPIDETPLVDDIVPEEGILENIPEEAPVNPSADDDFIFIRYPQFPTFRHQFFQHPFLRAGPVFRWDNNGAGRDWESPLFKPQSRRHSLMDLLFPEIGGGIDTRVRVPSLFPAEEDLTPSEAHPGFKRNGFDSVYNNFFNRHRAIMPTFKFDTSAYPDNYSNSTHKIHEINGTKFAVNETIKKSSGDNFHNYFHVRVIRPLPNAPVPEEEIIPSRGDTVDTELIEPVEDTNELPLLPEIYNEAENELSPEVPKWDDLPSSHMLNDSPNVSKNKRKAAEYHNPPDLSGDTKVNRVVGSSKQMHSRENSKAEVFDLNLVLQELKGENE